MDFGDAITPEQPVCTASRNVERDTYHEEELFTDVKPRVKRAKKTKTIATNANSLKRILFSICDEAVRLGNELETLLKLARVSCSFASVCAFTKDSAPDILMRYVSAYFRERISLRKFESEKTPTKQSLAPYYMFADESICFPDGRTHCVYTIVGPSITTCLKGVCGIPMLVPSYSPHEPWHERRDKLCVAERIKTKNWELRNPIVRLATIIAQKHSSCCHAKEVENWLENIKKWPLSREKKVWLSYAALHDKPSLLNFNP